MRVLAIESSGRQGSVALLDGDRIVGETIFETGMVHGRDIAPAIEDLARRAGWALRDLDLVAVDLGPGSYTGLRVGLAAAKGLCLALSKPLAGASSLDALVAGRPGRVAAMTDAKWNQVYGALYEDGRRVLGPVAEAPVIFAAKIPEGALVVGNSIASWEPMLKARKAVFAPKEEWWPRASTIGRLAAASNERIDPAKAVPLYLKPIEAEPKAKKP